VVAPPDKDQHDLTSRNLRSAGWTDCSRHRRGANRTEEIRDGLTLVLKMVFAPSKVSPRVKEEFPFSMALRPSQIRATAGDASLMISGAASLDGRYQELMMPVAIMAWRGGYGG
jgi:hypothetical protein